MPGKVCHLLFFSVKFIGISMTRTIPPVVCSAVPVQHSFPSISQQPPVCAFASSRNLNATCPYVTVLSQRLLFSRFTHIYRMPFILF